MAADPEIGSARARRGRGSTIDISAFGAMAVRSASAAQQVCDNASVVCRYLGVAKGPLPDVANLSCNEPDLAAAFLADPRDWPRGTWPTHQRVAALWSWQTQAGSESWCHAITEARVDTIIHLGRCWPNPSQLKRSKCADVSALEELAQRSAEIFQTDVNAGNRVDKLARKEKLNAWEHQRMYGMHARAVVKCTYLGIHKTSCSKLVGVCESFEKMQPFFIADPSEWPRRRSRWHKNVIALAAHWSWGSPTSEDPTPLLWQHEITYLSLDAAKSTTTFWPDPPNFDASLLMKMRARGEGDKMGREDRASMVVEFGDRDFARLVGSLSTYDVDHGNIWRKAGSPFDSPEQLAKEIAEGCPIGDAFRNAFRNYYALARTAVNEHRLLELCCQAMKGKLRESKMAANEIVQLLRATELDEMIVLAHPYALRFCDVFDRFIPRMKRLSPDAITDCLDTDSRWHRPELVEAVLEEYGAWPLRSRVQMCTFAYKFSNCSGVGLPGNQDCLHQQLKTLNELEQIHNNHISAGGVTNLRKALAQCRFDAKEELAQRQKGLMPPESKKPRLEPLLPGDISNGVFDWAPDRRAEDEESGQPSLEYIDKSTMQRLVNAAMPAWEVPPNIDEILQRAKSQKELTNAQLSEVTDLFPAEVVRAVGSSENKATENSNDWLHIFNCIVKLEQFVREFRHRRGMLVHRKRLRQ